MQRRLSYRAPRWLLIALGVILLLAAGAAAFPVALLKNRVERHLTASIGSPVRIGSLRREDVFSFSPVINAADVTIAQAAWAGRGDMASIRTLRLRVHLLALLTGSLDTEILLARGVRLDLVRAADGRVNWSGQRSKKGGSASSMAVLSVENAVVRYRDAVQDRSGLLHVRVDPVEGLDAAGSGSVGGAPVIMRVKGGPMVQGRAWAFTANIDGKSLNLHVAGKMAGPLRTDEMTFHIDTRADDLKRIDRIIEAGLFGTRTVHLAADVAHSRRTWTITALSGTIGRSDLQGRLNVRKTAERTLLDGEVHFSRLDFDDLASESGNQKAAALEAAQGLRLVPNTRINIRKIDRTDGRISVRVDRVLAGKRPSAITDLQGVLALDDRILTVEPLRIGLREGAITGRAVVNQRQGQPKPTVTLTLDMIDSRISALAGGGENEIDGRVDARVRLKGIGDTVREAVGNSDGSIGMAAAKGALPTRIAALIGFDIGKVLIGDDKGRSSLRCGVLTLAMQRGRGKIGALVIDTDISQSRGDGSVRFPGENLDISLTGKPKGKALLRLPGSVHLAGTIREPELVVPQDTKSVGNIFKAVGRAIGGKNGPRAIDADCDALTKEALGR